MTVTDTKTDRFPLTSVPSRLSNIAGFFTSPGFLSMKSLHFAIIALAMSTLMHFAFIAFHRTLAFVDSIVGGRS